MRIKCPECKSELSLNQPKPGSYKPKCKHCGKPFRLKVTDDKPPKIGIGKIRPAGSSGSAGSTGAEQQKKQGKPAAPTATEPKPAKSPAPAAAAAASASAVEATMDSVAGADTSQPAAGNVEATMDSVASGVDATMDSAASDGGAAMVSAASSGVDATMDSVPAMNATMDSSHADATSADATMDSASASVSAGASQTSVRPGKGAADKTQANVDATVDGTVTGSQASVSQSIAKKKPTVSQGGKASKAMVSAGGSASKSGGVAKKRADDAAEIPERLGGYRILRLLGRGAMGAVYEAKQTSLDRLVALKTIRGRLAANPAALARFTREAYAAAQLTHHNVVQIYDFGEDDGKHYFSMEWVRGGPLDDVIKDKGALDPKLAAGYVLQAARGLQFAHRNGMVHRDIKPANLLLSDEGVVKVADLGLVKVPDQPDPESDVGAMSGMESGTQVTMQGTAVGTPAYMAPEQGVDAAGVDHRADIYSLGCTLFFLLTGRPPFEGSVVSEVLDQHANQPLPSMVKINARVPESLEQVVERSMAKRPEDRYHSISEMIDDLEAFLGVSGEGEFSPTSDQADKWEKIAMHYSISGPSLKLAKPMMAALVGVSGLLTLVGPFLGLGWLLLGPSMFVAAIVTALVLGATGGRSAVVNKIREWLGSLSWLDYVIALVGLLVFLMVALIAKMLPGLIVGVLLGGMAGAAYHFLVVAPARRKREPVVKDAERFVRDLRIDGADEEGVRSFTARYAGKQWQAMYEALYGYDALCEMREQLHGDPSFQHSTAGGLRDKVAARFAGKSKANREARDHARLAKIEERGLASEGVSASDAKDRAWQMAAAVMDNAKAAAPEPETPQDAKQAAEEKRQRMKAMLAEARSGKYKKQRDKLAPLRFALGGHTRLLAGCLLLAVFAIWGNNNGLFDVRSLGELIQKVKEYLDAVNEGTARSFMGANPISVGIAGLLLCMSSFVSGWRMSPFALVATLVILFGHSFGIPGVGELLQPWMVSALVGLAIYFPGIIFGESKDAEW